MLDLGTLGVMVSKWLPKALDIAKQALPMVIDAARTFGTLNDYIAKTTGEMEPINSNSTAEDVSKMAEILAAYKENVEEQSEKISQAILGEMKSYFEEVGIVLEAHQAVIEKYQIHPRGLDRKTKRFLDSVKRNIDESVSRDISLHNMDYRRIIEMPPGQRKEEAMSKFLGDSIQRALESCCVQFRETLEDIFDEMEEEIPGTVQRIAVEARNLKEAYEKILDEKAPEEKITVKEGALKKIAVCEVVNELLEE